MHPHSVRARRQVPRRQSLVLCLPCPLVPRERREMGAYLRGGAVRLGIIRAIRMSPAITEYSVGRKAAFGRRKGDGRRREGLEI